VLRDTAGTVVAAAASVLRYMDGFQPARPEFATTAMTKDAEAPAPQRRGSVPPIVSRIHTCTMCYPAIRCWEPSARSRHGWVPPD
jgi:hypothetical protein